MSRKYKFHNPESLYFICFATVYWIDVFIRNEYKWVMLESWGYCQKEKGLDIHTKYNASKHTQGVFSIGNMSRSNYSINYYDAKTGNYLGVINYSLGGGPR